MHLFIGIESSAHRRIYVKKQTNTMPCSVIMYMIIHNQYTLDKQKEISLPNIHRQIIIINYQIP